MSVPHGPFALSAKNQVVIPKRLVDHFALKPGDDIWVEACDDGTIRLLTAEAMGRLWAKARESEDEQDRGRS